MLERLLRNIYISERLKFKKSSLPLIYLLEKRRQIITVVKIKRINRMKFKNSGSRCAISTIRNSIPPSRFPPIPFNPPVLWGLSDYKLKKRGNEKRIRL